MAKNIAILGSTGSIGVQTLETARNLGIKVSGMSANSNLELLEKQIREFRPELVAIGDEELSKELRSRITDLKTEVVHGAEGLKKVATLREIDTVVTSVVGIVGLLPTMEAIKSGKNIALANKETLVAAGKIVMNEAAAKGVNIFPVDSEHSAIYQCLMGNSIQDVKQLILTASGGPFRGKSKTEMSTVTVADALKHPNWKMGSKITIDSATLMNKGLEVIEARWLFDIEPEKIKVVVHPQSIIHSMVEYEDGSIMAQMGSPDMRIPIQLALTYPKREKNSFSKLDILKCASLTFEAPDLEAFPCLKLAYDALNSGGTMPVVMNAANEVAVSMFLSGKISFQHIARIIDGIMNKHCVNTNPTLDDIIEADRWARETIGGVL